MVQPTARVVPTMALNPSMCTPRSLQHEDIQYHVYTHARTHAHTHTHTHTHTKHTHTHNTHILTISSFCSLTGGSVRNGEKLQIQLFTDTHVGNAIPTAQ